MPDNRWAQLAIVLALIAAAAWLNVAFLGDVKVTILGRAADIPLGWLPISGLVVGLTIEYVARSADLKPSGLLAPHARGVIGAAVVVGLAACLAIGVANDGLDAMRASMILLLGVLSLLVTFYLLEAIRSEGITFDTHWGGIGGGLGGWRISPAAALSALLLVLAGTAVTLAIAPPKAEPTAAEQKEKKPAAAPAAQAPAAPGKT